MPLEDIHVTVVSEGKSLYFACKQSTNSNYSNWHPTGPFMKIEGDPEEWTGTGVFISESGRGQEPVWQNSAVLVTEP